MRIPSPRFATTLVSLIATTLAGCASSSPADRPPIVIGAVYNLTGSQAGLDVPSSLGARLAVESRNASGGVLGRRIELVTVDAETDPDVTSSVTEDLLADHPDAVAVIGLSDTDFVLDAAPIAAEHARVFLTSGATSPRLPDQVPTYLFLACFGDNVQAAAAAEWLHDDRGARRVAVVHERGHEYTRLLQGYFRERFEQLGGTISAVQTDEELDPDALRDADAIYLAATPSGLGMIRKLRESGITAPIVGGDGLDDASFWAANADLGLTYFTTHAYVSPGSTDELVREFARAFENANPGATPDAFAALGYDAAMLVIDAIERAGSADPDRARRALARTKGFRGVTGEITYDDGSRVPRKTVTILEVSNGTYAHVAGVTPAGVPAP